MKNKKNMIKMIVIVFILFGLVFIYKGMHRLFFFKSMNAHKQEIVTVSTTTMAYTSWQPQLTVAGSLRAIVGVEVTTELAGMIRTIHFTPGSVVHQGDLLVQLNIDPEVAQLHQFEANATLMEITYRRDKAQYAISAVSKATVDTDEANLKSALASVEQQKAIIAQKTIRAPFSGKLGISLVNPGQYLNPGDKITSLQTWDPIYVDFYVPQQWVGTIQAGQTVQLTVNAYPKLTFAGTITTINPAVESNVRNIQVEATIPNGDLKLIPGMFATVMVAMGKASMRLTLPEAAISFNPYGATVYVVKNKGQDVKGHPLLIANQVFVQTGDQRGDQVEILSGLAMGEVVVTSGQLKLRNGSHVVVNNTVQPTNQSDPQPVDE